MVKQRTEEKVFSFMEKYDMLRAGDKVILGVSGGADSVCLLFLLLEYRKRVPFEMLAVHVDHGIRGKAAEEDAAWVAALCREQGLAFRLEHADVRGFAAREKCSEEDAGRRLRYEAFRRAAGECGGTKIAVAHNAGDRAETMLLHLFRGSGLKGLRGIEPVRADIVRRAEIVRPVLCLERSEIEQYLNERGLSWRTDVTNEEDEYTRNRVRHHLLPWVEREVCAGAVGCMCRTADVLSETEDYLRQQTDEALASCAVWAGGLEGDRAEVDVERFLRYHSALRKRMLLALAESLSPTGKDISSVHVDMALSLFEQEGNRSVDLPFGICFRRQYGKVVAGRQPSSAVGRQKGLRPGQCSEGILPELEYSEFFAGGEEKVPENQYTKWFDCGKIKESPVLRFRRTGDYLTISDGRGNICRKSLKDYMITEKIPREVRDRIPVLAEGSHVLWLLGYRISEYYKIDGNTKCILQVKVISDKTEEESCPDKRDLPGR